MSANGHPERALATEGSTLSRRRFFATLRMTDLQKKTAANTQECRPQPYYFKRPVDCDDEESLEERRGRTVLRTAMLSTRADRYYGPPDGIQPEFDLLSRHNRCRDRAANCIGQFAPRLKPKSGSVAGRRTIHHNSSSGKTSVTPFREQDFKIYGEQTVCR